jgi:hypothetical protein
MSDSYFLHCHLQYRARAICPLSQPSNVPKKHGVAVKIFAQASFFVGVRDQEQSGLSDCIKNSYQEISPDPG